MKRLQYKYAVALAAAFAFVTAAAVQAATCTVPSGAYPTIQSAVNDVSCATINVLPGTYNENVVVARSCEINGAKAGNNDFATRSANPAGESIVNGAAPAGAVAVFSISASDVTIDGFTIKDSVTSGAAIGIAVRAGGDDAAIMNNIFDTITTTDTGGNGTAQAVYLTAGGADGVNIEKNEMKNVQSARSSKGVLIGDNGISNNPSQNVQVKGNSIHNITSTTRGAYGVSVANVLNVSGLKITGNSFSALTGGGWVHGVGLEGDTPGAMINDNDFSNLNGPVTDTRAVWIESEDVSFASCQVHGNNFNLPATQYGIAVDPALGGGPLDGTCNWWNSPSGPTAATNPTGTGASVSPNVTYNPWLIAPAPGSSCFGGNVPTTAAQCKNGGWTSSVRPDGSTFKNQGDCMQYVNTSK
jgi:hypothetical protein